MANPNESDLPEDVSNWFPLNVAVFDRNLELVWCNKSFTHFVLDHGAAERQLVAGDFLFDIWPDGQRIIEPQWLRLQAGEPMYADATYLRSNDLETYWDLTVTPQPEGAEAEQFTLALYDVTRRVKAYQSLERQMADRMRKLKALYDVMQVAGESLDLPTTVVRTLRQVLTAVRAKVGMVHLLDESGQHLQLAGQHGLEAEMEARLMSMPADIGLAGQVLRQRRPIVVSDIRTNEHTRPIFRQSSLQVYVGVTMRVKGRIIGVLGAFWEGTRSSLQEDVDLLDSAADQIAVAVENQRLRQKAEQLAIIEERTRLARDLHDSVSQALYSISLLSTAGRRLSRSETDQALLDETLADLGETARQALKEMRLLLYRLRPLALQFDGLVGALRQRLDAVEKRAGIDGRLSTADLPTLPTVVEETLYHIVQEALNNALKHSDATAVTVDIQSEKSESLKLVISDNGRGFDPTFELGQGGMGLANMRERAESLGGTLSIESAPGRGTIVTVALGL